MYHAAQLVRIVKANNDLNLKKKMRVVIIVVIINIF
jgi:hypothetical protein